MKLARRDFLLGAGMAAAAAVPAMAGEELFRKVLIPHAAAPSPQPVAASSLPMVTARFGAAPASVADVRRVLVHNLHTGDKLNAVYFEKGRYVPDALAEAMRVLRDWRNGQEHVMDPRLFDVLHHLGGKLDTSAPFQIISGYRSPKTNAMMHERSAGVASHSQHVLGRALDIRVDGVQLAHLHNAAMSLKAGGVGFYPVSNFVHVDVGPVRAWQGV